MIWGTAPGPDEAVLMSNVLTGRTGLGILRTLTLPVADAYRRIGKDHRIWMSACLAACPAIWAQLNPVFAVGSVIARMPRAVPARGLVDSRDLAVGSGLTGAKAASAPSRVCVGREVVAVRGDG